MQWGILRPEALLELTLDIKIDCSGPLRRCGDAFDAALGAQLSLLTARDVPGCDRKKYVQGSATRARGVNMSRHWKTGINLRSKLRLHDGHPKVTAPGLSSILKNSKMFSFHFSYVFPRAERRGGFLFFMGV